MFKILQTNCGQIFLAMLLFATAAPAVAERATGQHESRPVRPVRLSSEMEEKSVELIEPRRGIEVEQSDDYTSTLVGGPLMLAFFYVLVSSSVRTEALA